MKKTRERQFSSVLACKNVTDDRKSSLFSSASNRNPSIFLNDNKTAFKKNFGSLAFLGLWKSKSNSDVAQKPASESPISTPSTVDIPPAPPATSDLTATNSIGGYIPEPPPIIDENIVFNSLGEATLHSLGLGSYYTPVGWMQNIIEFFHVSLDLPWYQAVAVLALVMRVCLFPVQVKAQQNAARMRKIGPELARMNQKLTDAKISGNSLEIARASHEYMSYMKSNNLNPLKMFIPMIQAPFFVSAFMAIRSMCKLPVESLSTGGALWFTDLTLADPYYLLPLLASSSILYMVYRGVDTGMAATNMSPAVRLAIYGASAVAFPFFIFMPSGVMCYVVTSNIISLSTSILINQKPVKKLLNIPFLTEYEELKVREAQKEQKNFMAGLKDSMQNQRMMAELKEREKLREKQFKQAGTSAPIRTFKENPALKKQQ